MDPTIDDPIPDDYKKITIRGINSNVYDEFTNKVKTLDMNIGDALTKMMADVIKDFDEALPSISAKSLRSMKKHSISHHKKLSISRADLEVENSRFSFSHITRLKFGPDVTQEVFEKHVSSVSHCRNVILPNIFPKLVAYSMLNFCETIEFYPPGSEPADNSDFDEDD
jgi:hypothetical protein